MFTSQETQNICITFVQRRPSVFDVGPTLYKYQTNVLCLLGAYLNLMGTERNCLVTLVCSSSNRTIISAGTGPDDDTNMSSFTLYNSMFSSLKRKEKKANTRRSHGPDSRLILIVVFHYTLAFFYSLKGIKCRPTPYLKKLHSLQLLTSRVFIWNRLWHIW